MHGFTGKTGSEAVSFRDVLKMKTLILGLMRAQPAGRFKPVQLRKVLGMVQHDNPGQRINPTKLLSKTWCKVTASEVMTMMYQWRGVMRSSDIGQQLKHFKAKEVQEIHGMIAACKAFQNRPLKARPSAASSEISVDSAGIPTMFNDGEDEEEEEEAGEPGESSEEARPQ